MLVYIVFLLHHVSSKKNLTSRWFFWMYIRFMGFVRFSTHAFQLLLVDVHQPSGEAPWMLGPCPKVHRPLSSVTLWEDGSDPGHKHEIPDDGFCIAGTLVVFGQLHRVWGVWYGLIGLDDDWWLGQSETALTKTLEWLMWLTFCWLGLPSRGHSGKSLEAGIFLDKAARIWLCSESLIFDGCVAKDEIVCRSSCEALHVAEELDVGSSSYPWHLHTQISAMLVQKMRRMRKKTRGTWNSHCSNLKLLKVTLMFCVKAVHVVSCQYILEPHAPFVDLCYLCSSMMSKTCKTKAWWIDKEYWNDKWLYEIV